MLLAADTAPIDALCEALAARGLAPAPLFVTSLKDADRRVSSATALARLEPGGIVTTTAFAAGGEPASRRRSTAPACRCCRPCIATTKRAAWQDSARGLGAADLAMHVVLPELDGRVLAGAIAFKDALPRDDGLAFTALRQPAGAGPHRARGRPRRRAGAPAANAARERRVAILMPDYPGAPGRTGYAVGLDVPASVVALLADLAAAGYARARDAPQTPRALLDALARGPTPALPLDDIRAAAAPTLPAAELRDAHRPRRGASPRDDPDVRDGAFRFRARAFGNIIVALPPDRGRAADRRADYHDPTLPPRHALLAFGLWLRHVAEGRCAGAHGRPRHAGMAARQGGRADARLLSRSRGRAAAGVLSVHRQQSRRGRAGQAPHRRRHHRPPAAAAGRDRTCPATPRELERLVDEYAQADGLDRRRRDRLAGLIVETAQRSGLAREAGVDRRRGPDEALRRIDAWLCDLKDLAIKDGLHIYGRAARRPTTRAGRRAPRPSATALLAALDGRRVARRPGRRAGARPRATCCRPAAISSPPIRARCRRRPPWISAGSPPTK